MCSYPSKDSTHSQPYRVTTACAFLSFARRAVQTSRGRVAARSVQSFRRFESAFKALLRDGSVPPCAVADDRWPTLPWASGSPSRSFDHAHRFREVRDEQPGRLRGPFAVPIERAPVGSIAAIPKPPKQLVTRCSGAPNTILAPAWLAGKTLRSCRQGTVRADVAIAPVGSEHLAGHPEVGRRCLGSSTSRGGREGCNDASGR